MAPQLKCAGCMKFIKESLSVKCSLSACGKCFCTQCINVNSFAPERKKTWVCPECAAAQKKGGDNNLTPVRVGAENITNRKKLDSTESDAPHLSEQLSTLTVQFSAVVAKLEEVTESLSHNNARLDEVMLKLQANEERLKYLEKRDKEVDTLQATVVHLQNELKAQAQYNLRNEIEIAGIPETASENLQHTILVAAKKVGVDLVDSDIDWVARVGPRRSPASTPLPEDAKTPRVVVVRLLRRIKRDMFLRASKSRKNLSSADLDVPGISRKVFLNERLTKDNRILFRDARGRAKMVGYTFCWCSQGSIYVRQREGKAALLIQSHKDLDRLLPATSAPISSAACSET